MKSYDVTIQMKPLQQYFHMVLFIQYVVLTFESVNEILWCDHSNHCKTASTVLHLVLFTLYVVLTFESVNEILWYDHSNETSLSITFTRYHLFCFFQHFTKLNVEKCVEFDFGHFLLIYCLCQCIVGFGTESKGLLEHSCRSSCDRDGGTTR